MTPLPQNPYVAGNPVGASDAFIGRRDVLRAVGRILRQPQQNAVVLYGQRRIGKTSILQHLSARLPDEGSYVAVDFDLQDKADWPLDHVLRELARAIADRLEQPAPTLGDDVGRAFRDRWLPAALATLSDDASLVLLFDEFDVLADPQGHQAAKAFFPYLRHLMGQDRTCVQFVFVIGRNVDDLSTIALSLFKGTPYHRVSLLNHAETLTLVRLAEQNQTLRWSAPAIERVWALTHGHPYLTQQLCSHVWERAYDDAEKEEEDEDGNGNETSVATPLIAPADVDGAVAEALDASRNTLEWLWGGLGPAERVVASALAEAGRRPITQEELERILLESGVRVIIRELQNAPELLQEWDILEPADGGFRFRVELLRRWLVDHKPLTRVQEELDHVEPVAESFYQAGLGLYRSGRLEAAIQPLQQAMNINPNHIRATELLADIYLAQGQPDEAREILDRLYDYHPAAARPRLIQVLLSEARRIETEEERLPLYEQILAMHPGQREAQANVRRIWGGRGDAAQDAGKLEEALAAYERAGLTQEAAHIREKLQAQQAQTLARQMQALEAQEAYDEALEIAQQLRADYAGDWVTETDIERLVRKVQLKAIYQRAKRSRDMKTAKDLLVEVLTIDPMYKDTAHLLNEVVTALKASQQDAAASVTSTSATEPPLTSPPQDAANSPPSPGRLVKSLHTPWLIGISAGIAFLIPTLSLAMGILPTADFPSALILSIIVSLIGMMIVSTFRRIEAQPQKRANWISTSLLLLLLLIYAFLFWLSFLGGWHIL